MKFKDPTGKFSINIGWSSSAGAGTQGGVTTGISIAFSKKYGISVGTFETNSIGSEFGYGASTGLKITLDPNCQRVETGTSKTLDVGGSGSIAGTNVGGEVSIDLDTGNVSGSASVGIGIGSPEGHATISITNTENISDEFCMEMNNFNKQLENDYINYCLEGYDFMGW